MIDSSDCKNVFGTSFGDGEQLEILRISPKLEESILESMAKSNEEFWIYGGMSRNDYLLQRESEAAMNKRWLEAK